MGFKNLKCSRHNLHFIFLSISKFCWSIFADLYQAESYQIDLPKIGRRGGCLFSDNLLRTKFPDFLETR